MGNKENRLVESVLFGAGKPVAIEEIMEAAHLSHRQVTAALEALEQAYNVERKDETSIEVVKAGAKYAMQVKKRFTDQSMQLARPEIKADLLKTLALIAFHQPVKQSNLRHMIGEKVYEDVDSLVGMHLVHSKPYGATEILTTTKLFPEYFGIDSTKPDEIRQFLAQKVVGSTVAQATEAVQTPAADPASPQPAEDAAQPSTPGPDASKDAEDQT